MRLNYIILEVISLFSLVSIPLPSSSQVVHTIVLPTMCMTTLWAEDFSNLTFDEFNAHPQPIFSFNPHHLVPDTMMTACNIPGFNTPFPWNIWIQTTGEDLNGDGNLDWNPSEASETPFELIFLEHNSCCCDPNLSLSTQIHGNILNAPEGNGIELVYVSFLQTGNVYPTYLTDETGYYEMQAVSVSPEFPLTIRPSRNEMHKLGVTTLDLIKLQKHLLGIETLTSPYQYIAADANKSNSLSAIDLIEIRKIILGTNIEFPNSPSWRFVREGYQFPDPITMWPYDTFLMQAPPHEITLTAVDISESYDFIGVKIGDINGAYIPGFSSAGLETRSTSQPIQLSTPDQDLSFGQRIEVPIYANQDISTLGFQLAMSFPGLLWSDIRSGQIDIQQEHFALSGYDLTLSWFEIQPLDIRPNAPLFTLIFTSETAGELSQILRLQPEVTPSEWYTKDELRMVPRLEIQKATEAAIAIRASVAPNPWTTETTLQCTFPQPGKVRLIVSDALGRVLYDRVEFVKGESHSFRLSNADLHTAGTFRYTLISADQRTTGIMVVTK